MNNDWITVPLGKAVTLQRGFDLPNRLRKPGNVPIVTSSGIGDTHHEAMVRGPGVVTGRYGTIGEVFYIEGDFWPLNTTLFVRDFHGNDPLFISYLLRTIDFQTHSGKSGVPGVNRNDLHEEVISLPSSLAEQQAIAEALSDVDGLIRALDALIAKKRAIKQGAMQELLTGQRRLPGFAGAWEVHNLENICVKGGLVRGPFGGALKKEFFVKDGYKVYEQRNAIYQDSELGTYFIDGNRYRELKRFAVDTGDFIVSCSGTIGRIYQIPQDAMPGVINQALLKITINTDIINDKFFFQYFAWEKFQEKIIDNTQGGAMQNLVGMNVFKSVEIFLPPLPEQTAIAQILADMDAELAALAEKRAKTVTLKQGMMQELLTGAVRLG